MKGCSKCNKETCTCEQKEHGKPCSKCGKPGCKCGMKKDEKNSK